MKLPDSVIDWRDMDPKHHEVYEVQNRVRLVWRLPQMGPVFGWMLDELQPSELTSGRELFRALVKRIADQSAKELKEAEIAMKSAATEWLAKRHDSAAVGEWMARIMPKRAAP